MTSILSMPITWPESAASSVEEYEEERFMLVANAIHRFSDCVDKISCWLSVVILTAMVVITGAQIVCRVFFTALSWSEEATRYLLVWGTFLGAGIVYKHAGHISVTLVQDALPDPVRRLLQILVHGIVGFFCAAAVVYGFRYMGKQGTQLSAALRIPMRYLYLSIPVGCAIIDLHTLDAVVQLLAVKKKEVHGV